MLTLDSAFPTGVTTIKKEGSVDAFPRVVVQKFDHRSKAKHPQLDARQLRRRTALQHRHAVRDRLRSGRVLRLLRDPDDAVADSSPAVATQVGWLFPEHPGTSASRHRVYDRQVIPCPPSKNGGRTFF